MAFEDEKDGERRGKSAPAPENSSLDKTRPKKKRDEAPELGSALRSAYQRTVDEDIPPEMLDLLGKLS